MARFDESARDELHLWTASVVVLFDWLTTVDFEALPTTHRAQKQALADLLACIETDSRAAHSFTEDIRTAQELVAKDMGW